MLALLREKRLLWPAVMTLAGVALGIALGTWQLQRLSWKTELISTIEARTGIGALPPEAWPNLKCQTVQEVGLELSCEYMKLTLRGTWDHARERHVFISVPRQPNGIGGPGYWVFTPLKFADGVTETFVNRGFVPEGAKDPARRSQGQSGEVVELTGLLRSAEPRARFSGRNDETRNIWYVRNPFEFLGEEFITRRLPLTKMAFPAGPNPWRFYIDQTSPPPAGGLPLPLAGAISLPNRHLEYALTWFSLAATLLAVFGVFASTRWKE
jgi:surfeit locus 1 family protein